MKIATSFSIDSDTATAVEAAYVDLESKLGGAPSWMAVHGTTRHEGELVRAILQRLAPDVPFQGGTSCLGVMTEAGFHSDNGVGFGLFGIRDPEGVYGVGYAEGGENSRKTGYDAVISALQHAKKKSPPALVWITCSPGDEEAIIGGIEDKLGWLGTPIIGGSSADNSTRGNWYQLASERVLTNGVVVTAMYPSRPIRYAFDNGYSPTVHKGFISEASGRTIHEIDGRPAAEVYNEWTNGLISDYLDGGNILSPSTMHPLGRVAVWSRGATMYQLSHPAAVLENRALRLFTKVETGEEIVLMESTVEKLVNGASRISSKALFGLSSPDRQVAGALIIFCAGCMMAVKSEMGSVARQFQTSLGGQPFLGLHTFGEQGCALQGENIHANLMMAMVVFEK